MRLITSNLYIKPLNLFELDDLIKGLQTTSELEFAVLPSRYRNQLFADCLVKDIKNNIIKHPHDYLYYTIWLLIDKETHIVNGHLFFNGCPDACGEIELFSEIFEEEREHDLLKESINAVITWAANIKRIKLIRTNVPVNDSFMRAIMKESGFEKIAGFHHYENWIWKNEKNH